MLVDRYTKTSVICTESTKPHALAGKNNINNHNEVIICCFNCLSTQPTQFVVHHITMVMLNSELSILVSIRFYSKEIVHVVKKQCYSFAGNQYIVGGYEALVISVQPNFLKHAN